MLGVDVIQKTSYAVNGGESRPVILFSGVSGNQDLHRKLSIGRNWSTLGISMRYSFDGGLPSSDVTDFFFGLCASGRSWGGGDPHALGIEIRKSTPADPDFTPGVGGTVFGAMNLVKYEAGVRKTLGGSGFSHPYWPVTTNTGVLSLFVDREPSNVNGDWKIVWTALRSATHPEYISDNAVPLALWKMSCEQRFSSVVAQFTNVPYKSVSGNDTNTSKDVFTLSDVTPDTVQHHIPDEVTNGYLDSVNIFFSSPDAALIVHDVIVHRKD